MPISLWELIIIAIIAIIVIGPKKLPDTIKKAMMWYKHIRGSIGDIQQKIDESIHDELADTKKIVDDTKGLLQDTKIPEAMDFSTFTDTPLSTTAKKKSKKSTAKVAKKTRKKHSPTKKPKQKTAKK